MIVGPCTIVTGGARPAVIENAGVRVTGAHIAQLGPVGNLASAYPEETLWPARGRVLMPGLVNTHAHLARHLARGLSLATATEWRRYEQALSPEDVRQAVTAALVEGVRHGVTTVCDFHRSAPCIDLSLSEVLDAARAVGVRVATCYGASETDSAADRRAATEECLGFATDLAKQREGRLRGMIGIQATSLAGVDALLQEALEAAGDRLGVHVDLALDITPAERWKARKRWRESELPALWAHAEAAPRDLLRDARARGDALSAIGAGSITALAREVDVAWGSDSGVNAPPLFDTPAWSVGARAQVHYQRLFVNGAAWAARHFGPGLGEIAAGSPADFLLVDYRPATEFSSRTLFEHLCAGLLRAPVSGVMVAGEVIMDNGVLVSVDEHEVAERARECARRVWERLE
jgi:cytosine/adenosine deaminase-related metal-dependent hydrolase